MDKLRPEGAAGGKAGPSRLPPSTAENLQEGSSRRVMRPADACRTEAIYNAGPMRPVRTLLVLLLLGIACPAQQKKAQKKSSCDDAMTFCWYGDEVEVWGTRWVSDRKEDTIEVSVAIRCIKSLGVCMTAHAQKNPFAHDQIIISNIELMRITHWDREQVTANSESYSFDPCEKYSYTINRFDRTVLMVSSPGPHADTSACTGIWGKPRTVTYKLSR